MPRNKGQNYEVYINDLLEKKGVFPIELKGLVGNNSPDSAFKHNGIIRYVELKNNAAPDFGQKFLNWDKNTKKWSWSSPDKVTRMYDAFNVLNQIDKNFVPNLFTKDKGNFLPQYKIEDQKGFEKTIILGKQPYLHNYYAQKQCYYIQVEDKGFYHLQQDIADLGVPPFDPELYLRFRAKERDKSSLSSYSFLAVIRVRMRSLRKTDFDLEEKPPRWFPPIK